MQQIDPSKGWRAVAARLEATENPRHRHMLEVLIGHLKAEESLHLEGLLVGLVDEPKYHIWGSGKDTGPKGLPAIREYYTNLVKQRRGVLEYDIERIVVDDGAVVTEGFIRAYQAGEIAKQFGFDVPRTDATYLVTYRALIVWPFAEDGGLIGEDGYGAIDSTNFVELTAADIPDTFKDLFDPAEYRSIGLVTA